MRVQVVKSDIVGLLLPAVTTGGTREALTDPQHLTQILLHTRACFEILATDIWVQTFAISPTLPEISN